MASRNSNKGHPYDSKVKIHTSEISVEAKPGESGHFLGRQFHFPEVVQLLEVKTPTGTVRDIEILQKTKQASQIQDSSNYIIWNEFTFFWFFCIFPHLLLRNHPRMPEGSRMSSRKEDSSSLHLLWPVIWKTSLCSLPQLPTSYISLEVVDFTLLR